MTHGTVADGTVSLTSHSNQQVRILPTPFNSPTGQKVRVVMKELTAHRVNECNGSLKVQAVDEPGSGGAHHAYKIGGFNSESNPSGPIVARHGAATEHATILFQNGPIKESGVNGITNEVLLAIVLDRLEGFQTGPYKCRENALAITKIEEAMHWLGHRTRLREQRGVEGTHTV